MDDLDPASTPRQLAPAPVSERQAAAGSGLTLHWRSLSDGIILALLVGGPCLLAAEGLHNRAGRLWLLPVVIGAVGFLVAGGIAGRHRRRPTGAVSQGVAVALPVAVLLVLVDLLYRVITRRPVTGHFLAGLLAAVVGAMVVGAVGALLGRWSYLARIRRRRPQN
ncbi:MAG TPA: hypothetical protein VHB02_00175 [Acidimicrobiales bacterium]|nr:hypothetical protein [Acidimicrobiales bacterium]